MPQQAPQLTKGAILPHIGRLAVPNTLANVLIIIPSIIEAWRLAWLGTAALAGVALVFPLYMLMMMWAAGSVGGAVSGAVARAVGAQDIPRAEAIARAAIVIGFGGALFMGAVVLLGGRGLFALLGGSGEVLEAAWSYGQTVFAFGFVPWIYHMMGSVIRGSGNMMTPLAAVTLMTTVHIICAGPVIGTWGVTGAAALMIVAHGAGALLLFAYLRRPASPLRLRLGPVEPRLFRQLLGPGLLAASQSFMTILTSLLLAAFAARFGDDVLAGYGLGARIELLMIPLIFGVGGASIAMCGAATGAGLSARAIHVGWVCSAIAAAIVGGIGITLAVTAQMWAPQFAETGVVQTTLIDYIRSVGPTYGFLALGLALFFASQGIGTLAYPVIGAALRLAIVAIGGALLFSSAAPSPNGLFVIIALAMAAYGLSIALGLKFRAWRTLAHGGQ